MSEYFEFPKWIYHPLSGVGEIVMDAVEEAEKLAEWGVNGIASLIGDEPKDEGEPAATSSEPAPLAEAQQENPSA